MARAIDKQTMLDLIIEAKRMYPETGSFSEWLAEYLAEHLPAFTPPSEWISTDKRTPQFMKDVLVMFENGVMCVGFTYGPSQLERWSMHVDDEWCQSCKINPVYWMPLPKPPKEELKNADD